MPVAEQMTTETLGVGPALCFRNGWCAGFDAAGPPPNEASFQGAALFADISGYTRLAEVLLAKADEGLGELSATLSAAFARYVALVDAHGGEMVYFAGDSILVYWAAEGGTTTAECVRRAEACATELVLASHRAGEGGTRLHCGVGSGRLWAARVGGRDGCWHLVFGGSAVRDATRAGAAARPGETIVVQGAPSHREAGEAADLVGPTAIERLGDAESPEPRPLSSPPSSLVPRVMLERAASGSSDLGELRQITAVFARFEGFDEAEDGALSRMQHLASEAHRAVEAFSGATGRWVIDDKGLVFFVVFGIPYNAHADDPLRAVSAALSLREAPWPEGMRCGVGVASGRAFCGAIGGAARREFMTVGRPMIVAARLMVAGEDVRYSGRPPADDECSDIVFVAAPPLLAKGFTDPLPIFTVRRRAAAPFHSHHRLRSGGRTHDAARPACACDRGARRRRAGSRRGGHRKSCLVAELVDYARENAGLRPLLGKSEPVEYTPTLLPWRRIFRSLLGRGIADDLPALREALGEWLSARVDLAPFGPLLNAVLGLDLAETDATRHLRGPRRVEAMVGVMVDVLAQATPGPRIVVLEDCHWMDADSWRLAQAVAHLPMTFTILTARPTPLPPESSWLGDYPALCEMDLGPLAPADTEQLVRERLDAKSVSSHLVAAVQGRSGGTLSWRSSMRSCCASRTARRSVTGTTPCASRASPRRRLIPPLRCRRWSPAASILSTATSRWP